LVIGPSRSRSHWEQSTTDPPILALIITASERFTTPMI
jgi:hypothetical protein